MKFYKADVVDILSYFNTNASTGLTTQQAQERIQQIGLNELPKQPRESYLLVFLKQFINPLIFILVIAAVLIYLLGQHLDAFMITAILLFNALIGTLQEGRTRSILDALASFIKTKALVLRNGKEIITPAAQLVPGDIVLLQAGSKIPADIRLIESHNLQLNEATLTGEAEPVFKTVKPIEQESKIYNQFNMAFQGTYVVNGFAKGIVVATGHNTEFASIKRETQTLQGDFTLKQEMTRISRYILLFIFFFCVLLFAIGYLQGKSAQELLTVLTALFMCVVPEGLPVVLTLVLVSGAYKMAKKNVLIKKLQAIETLGRIDTLLIDKTGTLTKNEMTVTDILTDTLLPIEQADPANKTIKDMFIAATLLNRTTVSVHPATHVKEIIGDPTEYALYEAASKMPDIKKYTQEYQRIYEIPFDPVDRFHAGFFKHNNTVTIFVTGSAEQLLQRTAHKPEHIEEQVNQLLQKGMRLVGVATKTIPSFDSSIQLQEAKEYINNLKLLGFCAIQDAIRDNVAPSIQEAKQAGVHVVMITGDHLDTATYIAQQTGILTKDGVAITGEQFGKLNNHQQFELLPTIQVIARVSPLEKLMFIKLYQKIRHIVAMTGDGVNDVPAIVAANVGLVMGTTGSEITKEVADIVLLDSSFFNILYAIEQGRHIFYTLRRVILYFFATNFAEILLMLYALVLNLPIPLLPAQILWLNLITDGFLDVALAMEPEEKDYLIKQWNREQKLINKKLFIKIIYMAIPMSIGSLWAFMWYQDNIDKARTVTLLTMAMFQWLNAWNCRSEYKSIVSSGIFSNRWLILATLTVAGLQVMVIYNNSLQRLFSTVSLDAQDWQCAAILACSIVIIEEIRKLIVFLWQKKLPSTK